MAAAPAAISRRAAATTPIAFSPVQQDFVARGSIARVGDQYPIATTQAHHRMDGFDFVREVTAEQPHTPPPKDNHTLYPDWNEPNRRPRTRPSTPGAW